MRRQLNGRGSQYERGQDRNGDRRWQTSPLGEIPGQGDRSPSREGRQEEESGQKEADTVVRGSRRQHPEHREGQEMDQEVERQPIAANLAQPPDDPDRSSQQDGHRNRDSEQHPGVVPGEGVLVGLAEVDDLDVGKGAPAITAQCVVMSQSGQCFAPPGRVAKPAHDRREGEDGRPGLERRPLHPPERAPGKDPAQQPPEKPDRKRRDQNDARQVA